MPHDDWSSLYVQNLAAAEQAVRRGQFNAAKVFRALAHTQRALALDRVRATDVDASELLRRNLTALDPASGAHNIADRALHSLEEHHDVAESDVAPYLWGCFGCGHLVEGGQPETCERCGALGVEFAWFGPFYAANPEHLGQRSPDDIVAVLRRTADELAAVLDDREDADVTARPAPDEWSLAELVGHLVETDRLFADRVNGVLADQGAAAADRRRPWIQHIGKGYELMGRVELVERFRTVRAATLTLVEGLQAQDWMRRGSVGGTASSVLDLGTWLANHDVGHLAQARRPVRTS